MGLDMYANTTKRRLRSEVDFDTKPADKQLHYWRKHPNLHGWMERLYRIKGGAQEFNCATVRLAPGDIDRLEVMLSKPSSRKLSASSSVSPMAANVTMIWHLSPRRVQPSRKVSQSTIARGDERSRELRASSIQRLQMPHWSSSARFYISLALLYWSIPDRSSASASHGTGEERSR